MTMNDFSYLLSNYFADYLTNKKGVSNNTIKTYRDCFVSLIKYLEKVKKIKPNKITISMFDFNLINDFLDYLETDKGISVSTRNNRLAAIKSFFKYVGYKKPEYLNLVSSIREISKKKYCQKEMNYLTIEAIKHLLNSFNLKDKKEYRCFCIILLLYESGARVSELINIKKRDFRFDKPYTLVLFGKGNKYRRIPIDPTVIEAIKTYVSLFNITDNEFLFLNSRREKLTREGVNAILNKYFLRVKIENSSIYPDNISAHCLRHSKAMHLLENGVNLIYIRDLLGHSSVTTTEIYSKANPEIKRKHIEEVSKLQNFNLNYTNEKENELLDWLKNNI